MLELALGLIGILAAAVPFGIWWYKKRRSKRDALARTEADELSDGMDRVDKLQPPVPKA
jgi:hypothetical protein